MVFELDGKDIMQNIELEKQTMNLVTATYHKDIISMSQPKYDDIDMVGFETLSYWLQKDLTNNISLYSCNMKMSFKVKMSMAVVKEKIVNSLT